MAFILWNKCAPTNGAKNVERSAHPKLWDCYCHSTGNFSHPHHIQHHFYLSRSLAFSPALLFAVDAVAIHVWTNHVYVSEINMIRGKVSVRWNDDDDVGMIKKVHWHTESAALYHTRAHTWHSIAQYALYKPITFLTHTNFLNNDDRMWKM